MPRLIIESGDESREVALGDLCRIGRDKQNEVVLDDPGASRKHCRISRDGDAYVLEDLKSANGTLRNDEPVDRVLLRDGDVIQVGRARIRFVVEASADAGEIVLEDPAAEGRGDGRFELAFVSGERAGERVGLVGDRLTLGRRPDNTVVFKDAKVSGVHAEVCREGDRITLRDLGSTNGTFLEGKRIDEIPLDHGDRVTLGDNEFVLVDTTRPPPDLSAEPFDADRTIVDVPRAKVVRDVSATSRPMAAFGVVLVVMLFAGGVWFWWSQRPKGASPADLKPAAGNMFGDGWSFEIMGEASDPGELWESAEGHAPFAVVAGAGRSGMQGFQARPGPDGALAWLSTPVPCTTRRYQVAGFVRTDPKCSARIVVEFEDDAGRRLATPVAAGEGSGWTRIEGSFIPPSGHDRMRIGLVGTGEGAVRFDDLELFEGDIARPDVLSIGQFGFERTGPVVRILWGGDEILRMRGLSFESGGRSWSVETWLTAPESGSVAIDGGSARYTSSLDADARAATWSLHWKDATGPVDRVVLPISIGGALLEHPVGVVSGTKLDPYEDSFDVEEATGLILGAGGTRMRIAFHGPCAISGRRGGDSFELSVATSVDAGRLSAVVQVDFQEEKIRAAELLSQARTAEQRGELGQALNILDRIKNEFPFDERTLSQADEDRSRIQRQRDELLAELGEAEDRARFLLSPSSFAEAEALAARGAALFRGTEAAAEFERRATSLAEARARIDAERRARDAELLIGRMRTALAQDPPRVHIARAIREYLEVHHPSAAERAPSIPEVDD